LLFSIASLAEVSVQHCPANSYPVKAHEQGAYFRSDGTHVSAGKKGAFCRKFSSTRKMWLSRLIDGKPRPWISTIEQAAQWKPDEKERLLDTLEELPVKLKELLPLKVFRLRSSEEPGNAASSGGGNLVLYDAAFAQSNNLAHVVAHEASHYLYLNLSRSLEADFLRVAKWKSNPKSPSQFESSRPTAQYIRPVGKQSPREDFSDCIATYVTQPDKLKKISPEIYNWVESTLGNVLDGKQK
jgi:hypothetical protein